MKKYLPFFVLLFLSIAFFLSPFRTYLSWEVIRFKLLWMQDQVQKHPIQTPLLFTLGCSILVSLSFPALFILSLISGFLFPEPLSALYIQLSATLGASLVFLAARGPLHDFMKKRAENFMRKARKGFEKNGTLYLLSLRAIPVLPFWVMNLVASFLPISFWKFVWTTFLGTLPETLIYTFLGAGLSLELHDPRELLLNWKLGVGFTGLILSVLLLFFFKRK